MDQVAMLPDVGIKNRSLFKSSPKVASAVFTFKIDPKSNMACKCEN